MLTLLNKIRSFRYFDVCFAVCIVLIGLFTILLPDVATYILSIGLGILLLCFGAEGMLRLFHQKGADLYFFIRFIANLLLVFVGIGLLFFGSYFTGLVCSAIGIFLLMDASLKLFDLLSHPHARNASYFIRLGISALSFILGLALLITPIEVVLEAFRLLGVALLVEGIHSLTYAILRLCVKKTQKDDLNGPIETSFTDRTDK